MKFIKIVSLLSIIFMSIHFYSKEVVGNSIIEEHQKTLSEYSKIKSAQKLYDHLALQDLFKIAAEIDNKYLKKLEKDISKFRRIIRAKRKNKEFVDQDLDAINRLRQLHDFLKKYRLQIDIVAFHSLVKKDWNDLMQAVDKGQDILLMLPSKGIVKQGVRGLKVFINKINQVLRKAEEYETRLHADWIDLKLINYVLKIELVRLRNAAIFHPVYRGMPIVTSYPR
ncbi:hypothetical protein HYV10_01925 [Candidatus Dependentiae bacterium]|nr:hypothetical protein [Candidatus Dependentiae bacterium]